MRPLWRRTNCHTSLRNACAVERAAVVNLQSDPGKAQFPDVAQQCALNMRVWTESIKGSDTGSEGARGRTADAAVGLVGVHNVHGAVHREHHPRRDTPVHQLQVPLEPLRTQAAGYFSSCNIPGQQPVSRDLPTFCGRHTAVHPLQTPLQPLQADDTDRTSRRWNKDALSSIQFASAGPVAAAAAGHRHACCSAMRRAEIGGWELRVL